MPLTQEHQAKEGRQGGSTPFHKVMEKQRWGDSVDCPFLSQLPFFQAMSGNLFLFPLVTNGAGRGKIASCPTNAGGWKKDAKAFRKGQGGRFSQGQLLA